MARPTKLTEETREEICYRLAGGESLSSICRDDHLPTKATVLMWVVDDRDGFFTDYMRAREAAGYAHADQSVDVALKAENGEIDPQAARAALAGYHWAAERMAPKKHSQRQEVDHSSSDGSMRAPTRIEIVPASSGSDDQGAD